MSPRCEAAGQQDAFRKQFAYIVRIVVRSVRRRCLPITPENAEVSMCQPSVCQA